MGILRGALRGVMPDQPFWLGLTALKVGVLSVIRLDRLLGADEIGQKRPDAVLTYKPFNGEEFEEYDCALEVEVTHKKGRELDQALLAAAGLLERQEVGSVRYVSQSRALLDNYKRAIEGPINIWGRNEVAKKWSVAGQVRLDQWVIDSFEWCHDPDIFKGLFF